MAGWLRAGFACPIIKSVQRWMVRHAAGISCGLAGTWALLLLSAPFLASGAAGQAGLAVSALAYLSGSVICHQQPARSFHLASAQLPVCARCTGLYLAGAAGIVGGLLWRVTRAPSSPLEAGSGAGPLPGANAPAHAGTRARLHLPAHVSWRTVLILASLPIGVTVALEWAGAWAASNAVRAATGLPAGCAAGAFVVQSLSFRGKL